MSYSERKETLQAKLFSARQLLVETISSIQPEQKDLPTSNEGWKVWDIAVHVAGAESGMETIARRILAQDPNQAELATQFDINRYNSSMLNKRRQMDSAALLEMLARSRQNILQILENATEEELNLPGYHPVVGAVSLFGLLEVIAGHEAEHAQDIKEALEAAKL